MQKSDNSRLIVALDVPSAAAADRLVAAVGRDVVYKIGLQLFTAEGPSFVRRMTSGGHQVFLDLKFLDIPNTVSGAVGSAAKLGISMLTTHASGGEKMLRAAVEAASAADSKVAVLAVTVLTSMNEKALQETGVAGGLLEQVLRLAKTALDSGCHGVVASAHEAAALRREFGNDFLIVTPGVRPKDAALGDQSRVVTPAEAIHAGASHIVVGRPITESKDPQAAANAILRELNPEFREHSA